MKKAVLTFISFMILHHIFAQWTGSTTTTGDIYRDGNVGILTNSPQYPLHVNGTIAGSRLKILNNWDNVFEVEDNGKTYHVIGTYRGWDDKAIFIAGYNAGNNATTGFNVATEKVYIGNPVNSPNYLSVNLMNGNVGIHTTNAREAFQIGDRFVFQDGGWKGILSNMAWDYNLSKNVRLVAAPVAGFFFTDQGNTAFINGPQNVAGSTTDDAKFGMVIYNSAQVGIGTGFNMTFADQSFKLFVEGGIRTRKIKVDQANWADYVFHASYHLRTLDEIEQYLQQYHHLPDVPSAEEVEKKGLDLGDNQATLLRKIEELTLYVIEQNKEINKQQKLLHRQQQLLQEQQRRIVLMERKK